MAEDFDGVVAIVFRRGRPDKFVLVQNRKTGNVGFPSGAILVSDASAAGTMAREVRAQTGLKPEEYEARQIPLGYELVSSSTERTRQVVFLVETLNTTSVPEDATFKIRVWSTADEIIQMLAVKEARQLFEKALKFI